MISNKKRGAMPNRFNYRCPKCGSPDEIEICAFISVRLTGDGAEIDPDELADCGPHNSAWSPVNGAGCAACGFDGTVEDFERTGATIIDLFPTRQASRR